MIQPSTAYKNEKNKTKRRAETFDYFNTKYFLKPFEDTGFLETTERFLSKKINFFMPGRIYTWMYEPIGAKAMDFYDKRPLVLIHGQFISSNNNMIVQGVNLNLFPEYAKVEILDNYYNVFKSDIYSAEQSIDKNQLGTLNRTWQYLTNWSFVLDIFNKNANIGYQWGVRNYIIDKISRAVLVELEDWERIPYYTPKDVFGKGLSEVWGEYMTNKKMLSERISDPKKASIIQKKFKRPGG